LEFALEKLKKFGYLKEMTPEFKKEIEERLNFAKNWVEDFEKTEIERIEVSGPEKKAIGSLIEAIEKEKDSERLQTRIFEIAKENKIKPNGFFRLIYQIILKSNTGPRLGQYIIERGKEEIIKKLKESYE